jgi:N-acyl-D-glutamate deacylase
MATKGRLKVGADADIIVFDLEKVEDRATFVAPNQTSAGMVHVIVNGTPVIDSGKLVLNALPGRPIRRPVTA